jgi:chemotaxis protein MotA
MKRRDFSVLIGWMIGAVALGGGAMLEGIRLRFLWQPTAALIVFGGTLGAVVVRRSLRGVREALRATWALGFHKQQDELEAELARLTWLARMARREGMDKLEAHAKASSDPMVAEALALAADYADPAEVRYKLEYMLEAEDERGLGEVATLDAAGGYAPTFGIIGAVLGLIYVLRSLADPDALGAGIATAFVATIYGVGAANLIFFPLAARLRECHRQRMKRRAALAEALIALAAHESPNYIAARVEGRLPETSPDFYKVQA